MVPAAEFFLSIFTTALEPDELLVAVRISVASARGGWGFRLFTPPAGDFAVALSVAVALALRNDGAIGHLRLAVGGIGIEAGSARRRRTAARSRRHRSGMGWSALLTRWQRRPRSRRTTRIRSSTGGSCSQSLARDALGDAVESAR